MRPRRVTVDDWRVTPDDWSPGRYTHQVIYERPGSVQWIGINQAAGAQSVTSVVVFDDGYRHSHHYVATHVAARSGVRDAVANRPEKPSRRQRRAWKRRRL